MSKRKALDEWLATLLPPRQFPQTPLIPGGGAVTPSDSVLEIPLDSLDANPYQTRTSLDEKSLDELADSIKSIGLLEPIVVRANGGGRYQVIAGERRVKACYMAGVIRSPPSCARSPTSKPRPSPSSRTCCARTSTPWTRPAASAV